MSMTEADGLALYRAMLRIRRFEERCNALFLQGRIPSTLHLYIGQEAVAVGVCAELRRDDYLTSTHRPHGHALAKGVTPAAIMAELFAKATGCCRGKGGSMHVGDISVGMVPAIAIVGGGQPVAVGLGLAAKMRRTDQVVASFFGEGGANEGAVHEAMNMAAVWRLPVLFICENNLYGASTPVTQVVAVTNIADRAAAYGMPGVVVDGNDVLAVREVTREAVQRARAGEGPTLIECKTYRLCGHSRSDACGYRSREEEAAWRERDPLLVLARRLSETEDGGRRTEDGGRQTAGGIRPSSVLRPPSSVETLPGLFADIQREVTAEIDAAVAFAEESPAPAAEDTLRHVYWEDR
jgi:acetoin:2,6-dichlorophenolindophenol oxidoreductase subunit alpha